MKRKLILCSMMIAGLTICSILASAQENVSANQNETIKAEQITDQNLDSKGKNIEKKNPSEENVVRKKDGLCEEVKRKEEVMKKEKNCKRESKGDEFSENAREKGKENRERRGEKKQELEDESLDKGSSHGKKYGHQKEKKEHKEHEKVKENHGHGNNADHIDCSNPGKAPFKSKDSKPSLDDEKDVEKAKSDKSNNADVEEGNKPWWKFW